MKLQRLLSLTRQADTYHMIEEGDKIAVGISGGKDSLTLLYALHGLMQFYPKKVFNYRNYCRSGIGKFESGAGTAAFANRYRSHIRLYLPK